MATASISPTVYFSTLSERQKILAALVASVLLHLIAFIAIAIWFWVHRNDQPLKDPTVVEIAVSTPTPAPENIYPMLPKPEPPPVIDSEGLQKTDKAPEKPVFESDQNSVAGSMLPGLGKIPLPSQNGKDRPELAFQTKKFTLGEGEGNVAEPPVMEFVPAPDVPPPSQPQPLSTPVPLPKATPIPTPMPEPTAQPTPSPEPMAAASATPIPEPGAEPLYKPTPVPSATPKPTPDIARPTPIATPQPAQTVAMLTTPAPKPQHPQPPKKAGYQSDTQQTKIEDGISNRSKAGVDALGTPLGRYKKRIADAIGSRWYHYVNERMDLITTGSVRINFFINSNGHVEDVKIISNDGNQTLGNFSIQAITAAKIPPPPAELAPSLDDGRFEVTYTFTIYPN